MNYNIHIEGNVFYIDEDREDGLRFQGLAKDVLVKRKTVSSDDFRFQNVFDLTADIAASGIDISNISNFDTADEFEAWAETNTGKSSAGDSALKIFRAIVYKEDDSATAPVLIVNENTLGYDLNIVRGEAGRYVISGFQTSTEGKLQVYTNTQISYNAGVLVLTTSMGTSDVDGEINIYNYVGTALGDSGFRIPLRIELNI